MLSPGDKALTRRQMDAETVPSPALAAAHLLQDSPMRPQVSKYYYKKRPNSHSRNGRDDSNHHEPRIQPTNSPLSRQRLLLSSSSTTTYYYIGGFYEIDHDRLPPKSPIHLKSIRVVKVSDCTSLEITVSFPSLLALRGFFSSAPVPGTGPELDERFVMSSNHAARILRRRVAEEELSGEIHMDSFWLVNPCLYDFTASSHPSSPRDALPPPPLAAPPPAASSCLLTTLKGDGTGWGVRRRVRYVGRYCDASKEASSIDGYDTEDSVKEQRQHRAARQQRAASEDKNRPSNGKRKREESEGRSNKHRNNMKKANHKYKSSKKEKKRTVEAKDGDPRRGKERWSTERYAAAERSLLDIMRSRGARFGAPVMRQALREEARKKIGDTGLLDHLLKHMAGRVPEGSTQRFRRRHNADGAMEYWLEPAGLAEVRREAGVSDPYWVPPPGWKPGDDVSPVACDLLVKRQVEELAEEVNGVKRDMEQLSSNLVQLGMEAKSEADRAFSSWKEKYRKLVKSNDKLEKHVSSLKDMYENVVQKNGNLKKEVLSLKNKYESVVEKNEKLEEQMDSLSCSFLSLKEQLLLPENADKLKIGVCQVEVAAMSSHDGKQETIFTPVKPLYMAGGEQTSQQADAAVVQGGEKRTAAWKSSFRICRPQGTFLWPSMGSSMTVSGAGSSSCPSIGLGLPPSSRAPVEVVVAVSPEDKRQAAAFRARSTPPSASSTSSKLAAAAAATLLPLPSPTSPLRTRPLFAGAGAGLNIPALQSPPGLTLRHLDSSPSMPAACGARLLDGKASPLLEADAGGISAVGPELALALATPSYC